MRAVVTGAGSGLGRALALEAARRGARVAVVDLDAVGAAGTVEAIEAIGGAATAYACDVADPAAMEALAATIQAAGPVDLLCNNAGVAVSGPLHTIDHEDWEWIVGVNLWGVVHGCRLFLPGMLARGSGRIVNIASAAGLLAPPTMAPYNATKAAVVSLTETLWSETRALGIRSTVVCPTFFQTNIMAAGRGLDTPGSEMARRRMERSRVQAPEVARQALDAVDAGRLYCQPMADGRWLWRLKRLAPQAYHSLAARLMRGRS